MANSFPIPTHHLFQDLTGQRFGKLIAISYAGARYTKGGHKRHQWECSCDCGGKVTVDTCNLSPRPTSSKSCGCIKEPHGMVYSSEYKCWDGMRARCYNPRTHGYKNYGGRGIKVCDRWRDSFENFFADMGLKPTHVRYTLERIDSNGDYSPENCKWATYLEQANNRNTNLIIKWEGKEHRFAELCREKGINRHTAWGRLKKGKHPFEAKFIRKKK